ncbi:MAG: ATP-binding cassette domain-containing protein [Acidobacteriota bacterium]
MSTSARPGASADLSRPGMGSDRVISCRDAEYRTPDGAALVSGLRFEVRRRETLVLLGRSGSGKTTTLKLINRLLTPTAGEVLVEGRSTREWDPILLRRRMGYVIQEVGLLPHLSVEANVALVPQLLGWEPARIRERVRAMLELVGLDPAGFAGRRPRELSGGQRQRVGVARALAADPPVLLMDEPFGALDPVTRAGMQAEFRLLKERVGKTIVFVTHDVREALLLGTRIALLSGGRIAWLDTPEEFLRSADPEVGAFRAVLRHPGGAGY